MKVVGIISSANFDGNSATLVREALRGAAAAGATTAEIFLPKYRLEFCTGCLRCLAEGECFQDDEFESLRSTLYEADGIIFGTPTFGAAPNARLKNLFDRLGLYERFTSNLGGKHVAAISTASSPGTARKVAGDLARLATGGIFARGYITGTLGAKALPKGAAPETGAMKHAEALGRRLAVEIERDKRHPLQNLPGTLMARFVMRPLFRKAIVAYKDTMMRGVYGSLARRGLI